MKKRLFATIMALAMLFVGCSGCSSQRGEGTTKIKDGTYKTMAEGFAGDVNVETTIKKGKITKVKVLENGETLEIGGMAIEKLPAKIIENQSITVDTITGATTTSNAILKAVELAIIEAEGNVDYFKKQVVREAVEDVEKEAEVVIIGGGGAGLSAAVAAAEEGSKVILIEKTASLGGNTIRAGGPFNAVDPERQKLVEAAGESSMENVKKLLEVEPKSELHKKWMNQLKKDLEEYENGTKDYLFDSIALHILQTYSGGDYEGKLEFIEKLATESLPTSKWLASNGVEWKNDISTCPGGLWPRAHIPKNSAGGDYIVANEKRARDLGVEIIFNCRGKDIIMEDGRAVGVMAEMNNGGKVTLHAKKGVVLATGGFSANAEMRQKYDPTLLPTLGTTNSPAITGDGIKIAEKVGANFIGMKYIQCLPLGNPKTGNLNGWMGGIGVEYYYQVNKSGKRFMAEDGRRDTMTQALLKQEDAMSYVITDTNRESENKKVNLWGDNIEKLVEDGIVYRANTIEELAEKIGVNPQVLKATHDTFNKYVEKGYDDDFGRKLFGGKIDKPPFYASPRMPTVHHTMGGVEIDLQTHVLDKNGNIIPGLYAAGEVTGGIHGKNRLGGNALVDIHVFGRKAGKFAASGK